MGTSEPGRDRSPDRPIGGSTDRTPDRAARLEERFAAPVLLAALAAVPATFLSMLGGRAAVIGDAVNWLSLGVLAAESAVLLALTGDRRRWLRTHRFTVTVAILTIPAVLLAVGPVQVLRLLRFAGALRIMRVGRILRAGRILRRRLGPEHPLARAAATGLTGAAALFVALVLADPTSHSRRLVDSVLGRFGPFPALLAGALLGGSTYLVARRRRSRGDGDGDGDQQDPEHRARPRATTPPATTHRR